VSSARVMALLRHDARLQLRNGIYGAYAFVVALYAALLAWAGAALPAWVPAVLIFTDPAALGFFFLGALMMLERSERVRLALAVTPLSAGEYLLGKVLTLTLVALAACGILIMVTPARDDPVLLLSTVMLTSVQYVGIGVPIAIRFRTVNAYLVGSAGFLTPIVAPAFLALLDPFPGWTMVIPAVSQLRLMLVATGARPGGAAEVAVMLLVSAVAAAGGVWLGLRALGRELGRR
jgi:fluoroquinolone transport system permease protein